MTGRSTRNKIRWQFEQAIKKCDDILEHLAFASEMAEERSAAVNDALPQAVLGVQHLTDLLLMLRDSV